MKQPKRPTRIHKKLMSQNDLDPSAWAVVSENKNELIIINKTSNEIKQLVK